MRNVHKSKLKAKEKRKLKDDERTARRPKSARITFPWKWIGVGVIAIVLVLSIIILKPDLIGNSPPSTLPEDCVQDKPVLVDFTFRLHILNTNNNTNKFNYTHPIGYNIGKEPINGQPCTRRIFSGSEFEYNRSSQPAVIHVRSPEIREYRLYEFFNVWNQPINKSQGILVSYYTTTSNIIMKVDGQVYYGDWENLVLNPESGSRVNLVEFHAYWTG